MDACCEEKAEEIETLRGEHRKVLVVVLVINAVLFVVEAGARQAPQGDPDIH